MDFQGVKVIKYFYKINRKGQDIKENNFMFINSRIAQSMFVPRISEHFLQQHKYPELFSPSLLKNFAKSIPCNDKGCQIGKE